MLYWRGAPPHRAHNIAAVHPTLALHPSRPPTHRPCPASLRTRPGTFHGSKTSISLSLFSLSLSSASPLPPSRSPPPSPTTPVTHFWVGPHIAAGGPAPPLPTSLATRVPAPRRPRPAGHDDLAAARRGKRVRGGDTLPPRPPFISLLLPRDLPAASVRDADAARIPAVRRCGRRRPRAPGSVSGSEFWRGGLGVPPRARVRNLGFGVLMPPPSVGAMDLRLCLSRVFFSRSNNSRRKRRCWFRTAPNRSCPMERSQWKVWLAISSSDY